MPMFLLVIIMLLGLLVGIGMLVEQVDPSCLFVYFLIVIVGPISWMTMAWDQDWRSHEYHYVETLQYPSGKIVYMVYPKGYELGSPVSSDIPLTHDTIVRVSRRNAWKKGINWLNDRKLHFDIITPKDGRYNDLKHEARRKGIKMVDVEIKEKVTPRNVEKNE